LGFDQLLVQVFHDLRDSIVDALAKIIERDCPGFAGFSQFAVSQKVTVSLVNLVLVDEVIGLW
jgi:hypothetical protein